MQVTFWGTRGSIAKAGRSTVRYGGNTSCVEVRSDSGTLVVIDCGTGAHGLGQHLLDHADGSPVDGHILISHTHWDHIQGLPFFGPLFDPGSTWHIYGPRGLGNSLSETLAGQMQYSYFPVTLEQLTANVDYHDLVEGTLDVGDVRVATHYLNHPALTLGYRLDVDGATVVYLSDHEPHDRALAGGGDLDQSRHDGTHAGFAEGADLLIHDAQYSAAEYADHVGWGHSTVEYVVDVAHRAGAGAVALYHHDPTRTDDAVDELVRLARAHADAVGYEGEVFAAAEGVTRELRVSTHGGHPSSGGSAVAAERPALERRSDAILLAADTPDLIHVLRSAAEAEQLEILTANGPDQTVHIAHERQPAIILLEDTGDASVLDIARAIRDLDPPFGGEVALVSVGITPPSATADATAPFTEWLVWPSSEFYVRTKLHAWLLRRACRWQNAPLPADELRRVAALHALDILDTEPEPRFDRYTGEIGEALDLPVALVSLVDTDRQWFKSRRGLDATETPRDLAFCAHAILGDDVLQVPDALDDPRFADNPLVAGDPRLRFYAGMPLSLSDGTRVGTLCVADYRPRELSDDELDELRRVGRLVARELQERRT
jgi:phosphoribosyl 1,2-cyclic phosphodiesterase